MLRQPPSMYAPRQCKSAGSIYKVSLPVTMIMMEVYLNISCTCIRHAIYHQCASKLSHPQSAILRYHSRNESAKLAGNLFRVGAT